MKRALSAVWSVIGWLIAIQYLYFAWQWGSFGFDLVSTKPDINALWYVLGFGRAAVDCIECELATQSKPSEES